DRAARAARGERRRRHAGHQPPARGRRHPAGAPQARRNIRSRLPARRHAAHAARAPPRPAAAADGRRPARPRAASRARRRPPRHSCGTPQGTPGADPSRRSPAGSRALPRPLSAGDRRGRAPPGAGEDYRSHTRGCGRSVHTHGDVVTHERAEGEGLSHRETHASTVSSSSMARSCCAAAPERSRRRGAPRTRVCIRSFLAPSLMSEGAPAGSPHKEALMSPTTRVLLLSSLLAACGPTIEEEIGETGPDMTFEEFEAATYLEPWEGGVYIVNGDTPIVDIKQLR